MAATGKPKRPALIRNATYQPSGSQRFLLANEEPCRRSCVLPSLGPRTRPIQKNRDDKHEAASAKHPDFLSIHGRPLTNALQAVRRRGPCPIGAARVLVSNAPADPFESLAVRPLC